MSEIDDLVERSIPLKQELLEFAKRPQFTRALKQELRRRFGDPIVTDEERIANFFDWFIQQYRRPDGRTVVECFVDSRPDLPESEREFLLGWREVLEGVFEVTGRDDPALLTANVIDDLDYRIRANVGPSVFDSFPVGIFLVTRVVPVGPEWLISGTPAAYPAETREDLLKIAAQQGFAHPELVFRNPDRLARSWEIQRTERAAFVEYFGTDTVILAIAEFPQRMQEFAERGTSGIAAPGGDWIPSLVEPLHPDTETVGLIYDESDGLGVYGDLGLVEQAFAEPELTRDRTCRQLLKTYLTNASVSPVPLIRFAERDHAKADRVFRLLTGKPRFRWADDGEALLRTHKPDWYRRPPLPRTVVFSDRLAPYLRENR